MREVMFSATATADDAPGHIDLARFEQIANAAGLVQLGHEIRKVARNIGFAHYLYGARILLPNGDNLQYIYSGYPDDWMTTYQAEEFIRIDPVVEHCFYRNSNIPLVWSDKLFDTPERSAFWESAQGHGLASGLSVPVRGVHGEMALFSIANPEKGDDAVAHQVHSLGAAYLLGAYVHEAIRRLVYNAGQASWQVPELTAREIECLKWWVAGKSAWDIGQIFKLSERTVRFHLNNIKRKFDARCKAQVVAKAIQLKIASF